MKNIEEIRKLADELEAKENAIAQLQSEMKELKKSKNQTEFLLRSALRDKE